MTIGEQKIEPGLQYLTITHKGDRKSVLNVLDSASVRKYRIDPYLAHFTKGGTDVELEHKETSDVAEKLDIKIKVQKQQPGEGALVIRFGPPTLTARL